ncbi:MAG: carbohydrate kinase family protein [Chloroflexi bacterium]|nr:carbohydrate kinase family protein [Chloroflexota bacterium]MCC6891348.1 carbohydrate kinase family protein [Anaerolineae bacterium]
MHEQIDILVGGHLCLDLIPGMRQISAEDMVTPGRLYTIDPIAVSTGGAVSNTGLALQRLGVNVRLLATVGEDLIGEMILAYLRQRDPKLTDYIQVKRGQASSSTIALSPANADRTFLHCTGTNDQFGVKDIDFDLVGAARIFHLGYPTLLPHLVEADGDDLQAIYARAKQTGVVTSLDMAQPDPNGKIAHMNWPLIFQRTLCNVDIFIPSIEEMLLTLRRADYDRWMPNVLRYINQRYLHELADELLAMGVAVTGFKLGEMGIYLKTGDAAAIGRLNKLGIRAEEWIEQELWLPAFQVDVAGTTGAGDSAYAGFLAAMLKGSSPFTALRWACGVGACNVEAPDATSGIRTWAETEARLATDWSTRAERLPD